MTRELQLADEALDDAAFLLQGNRLKAAANRAYYAMFHAVQAALTTTGLRRPKTHSGAISLFGRYWVKTGTIDKAFAKNLQDAFDLRQKSDYDVDGVVEGEVVTEAVEKAQAFVAEVKRLFE